MKPSFQMEGVIYMDKNINAIEKIITELCLRDYKACVKKLTKAQKINIRFGKKTLSDYGGYTLSEETKEAMRVRNDYIADKITEEEYKRWCIEYNTRTV